MEVAASIIAFITITAQSAKIIHNTLAAVKDGPETLLHALQAVARLIMILGALEKVQITRQNDNDLLRRQVQDCSDDLRSYERKLGKLSINNGDRALGKLWKVIKTAMNEKDFAKMQSQVVNHTTSLSLHLQVHQYDSSYDTRIAVKRMSENVDNYHRYGEKRRLLTWEKMSTMEKQVSTVDDMLKSVKEDINRVEQASTTVSTQSKEMMDLILKLTDQISGLSVQMDKLSPVVELTDDGESPQHEDESGSQDESLTGIRDTVQRLLDLISTELGQTSSEHPLMTDNEEILGALIHLLGFVETNSHGKSRQMSLNSTRSFCPPCQEKFLQCLQSELRPLHGAVLSAKSVHVGHKNFEKRLFEYPTAGHTQSTQASYDVGFATLGISSISKQLTSQHKSSFQNGLFREVSGDEDNHGDEFSYRISVIPKERGSMLTLTLKQYIVNGFTISGIPSLSLKRVVSVTDPVFSAVKEGRLFDLKNLLIQQKATLWDHDPRGTSLLQYATHSFQPDVCRFLIEHGADLDHTSEHPLYREDLQMVMNSTVFPDDEEVKSLEPERFDDYLKCLELLVTAGANPTISILDEDGSIENDFSIAIFYGRVEAVRLMLDYGKPFTSVHTCTTQNKTALLEACGSRNWSTDLFQLLLERGADVNARDSHGDTCLHICLKSIDDHRVKNTTRMLNGLVYLVRHGADILTRNHCGVSVTDIAHGRSLDALSSFRSDIWDVVLAQLGHNVRSHRCNRPRIARYNQFYSMDDFRALWKGWEALCPYFDIWTPSEDWPNGYDADEENIEDEEMEDQETNFGIEMDKYKPLWEGKEVLCSCSDICNALEDWPNGYDADDEKAEEEKVENEQTEVDIEMDDMTDEASSVDGSDGGVDVSFPFESQW